MQTRGAAASGVLIVGVSDGDGDGDGDCMPASAFEKSSDFFLRPGHAKRGLTEGAGEAGIVVGVGVVAIAAAAAAAAAAGVVETERTDSA